MYKYILRFYIIILLIITFNICCFANPFDNLVEWKNVKNFRESSYDKSGKNDDFVLIESGKTMKIAEIQGPGAITHFWCTYMEEGFNILKDLVIIIYWDDEKNPSVLCPLGDFFGNSFGIFSEYSSYPFVVTGEFLNFAFNSYWKMPFNKNAKIFIRNDSKVDCRKFFYHVDYEKYSKQLNEPLYFHAEYRQSYPSKGKKYIAADIQGKGCYVGCVFGIQATKNEWWGEGDDEIIINGDNKTKFRGTGFEDYFCNAWCYQKKFSTQFYGCTIWWGGYVAGSKTSVYRFHILDPIWFEKSLLLSFESGSENDREDHYCSTVYWYQKEPHKELVTLPSSSEKNPPELNSIVEIDSTYLNLYESWSGRVNRDWIYDEAGRWLGKKKFLFENVSENGGVEIKIPAAKNGNFKIHIMPEFLINGGVYDIYVNGNLAKEKFNFYSDKTMKLSYINIGIANLKNGLNKITFTNCGKNEKSKGYNFSIRGIKIEPVK